jgi:hypothetical protein
MSPILQQLHRDITNSVRGLDATQTQLRPPSPGDATAEKWSIQQIVDHLCLTFAATETAISSRIAKGMPTRALPSFQQRVAQYVVTNLGLMPGRREAPAPVTPPVPQQTLCGEDLSAKAATGLAAIDKLFDEAEVLFGPDRCITHMILGPLSIHQWRRFHLAHGRHHVHQILAIRKANHV